MKNKPFALSFTLTAVVIGICAVTTAVLSKKPETQKIPEKPEIKTEQKTEEYENIADNVGAVSFTEDQLTELVRNMYADGGTLKSIDISLADGEIEVAAKITETDRLIDEYPELFPYRAALKAVENKKLSVKASLGDNDGRAELTVTGASVGNVTLPSEILRLVLGDKMKMLFDTDSDTVKIEDGRLIFYGELPEILQY